MDRRTAVVALVAVVTLSLPHVSRVTALGRPAAPPVGQETQARVDLNSASVAQLQALPGVGPRTAERIVEYRDAHGPFTKVEELMNVQGIGEKSFLKMRQLVVVSTPRTKRATS